MEIGENTRAERLPHRPPPKGKELVKRLIGPSWQRRAHRLSRLRWLNKLALVRQLDGSASLRRRVAYVLLDPETESFSYELDNEQEMIDGIAAALGRSSAELAGYAAEAREDAELHSQLARHLRFRFAIKHKLPLGHRLGWYVLARVLRPSTIVETGIYDGLGSLAMLRALERNALEGTSGELISFDIDPRAGSVVRAGLRGRWQRHVGSTGMLLEAALAGREVGLMIQDTGHDERNQRFEYGVVLAHAAPTLALIDGSGGWAPALPALCEERGGAYHRIPVRSRNHVHGGVDIALGVFERGR